MEQRIAPCGLDCAACPAYVATIKDDRAALARLAEEWGRQFGFVGTADNVRCVGCHATTGPQIGHCAECEIRRCAIGKGLRTCAECADYGCATLAGFIAHSPEATVNLEALRKGK